MSDPSADREIMWRRVMDDLSFELARLSRPAAGPALSGVVLVAEGGAPLRMDYRVHCDEAWRTRSVDVTQTYLGHRRALLLTHDGDGTWLVDGKPAPTLAGCTDVDLGISPSTNALPVNRLRLGVGESQVIRAAWVRFPSLEIVAAEQSYERVAAMQYRYRSLTSGFEALIDVDDDGLPTDYAGIWRRLAEGMASG
ncbi:putative glycolipid-binding domain-containing protein [Vineibacter terrae]|uniref:putative glycolipid-binding domain-containing protein n=1 Tax=Vineibacter terrae TaxID=2586908 RepID=UPI002E344BBB|nr:putative glycolipid-binding domain-containing protein [Vineibacter terrae]HEX2889715.1 putative glycolipid-binding domain-containing protein [Vineibacter terrae]